MHSPSLPAYLLCWDSLAAFLSASDSVLAMVGTGTLLSATPLYLWREEGGRDGGEGEGERGEGEKGRRRDRG